MVVTVEAPRYGDRMHTLAKAYQPEKGKGANAGTIFVRKQGRSVPAGPGDIHALEERLIRGLKEEQVLDLQVEWVAEEGEQLTPLDLTAEAVDEWLERRREAVVAMQPPDYETPEKSTFVATVLSASSDPRSAEEYLREVEEHLEACRVSTPGEN